MPVSFGAMLQGRRRDLGLSIQQVANAIKIRPQIIEFFELENFDALPPRGYAVGMISSYASYLGLDQREVVDAYFDALDYRERNGGAPRRGSFEDYLSTPSPRSSNARGRYLMTAGRSGSSRFASRPEQAGYVPESQSAHQPQLASSSRPASSGHRGEVPLGVSRAGYPLRGGARDGNRRGPNPTRSQRDRGDRYPHDRGGRYGGDPRAHSNGSRGPRAVAGRPAPARQRGAGQYDRRGGGPRRGGGLVDLIGGMDPKILLIGAAVIMLVLIFAIVSGVRSCSAAASSSSDVQDAPKVQDAEPKSDSGSKDATQDGEDDAGDEGEGQDASTDGDADEASDDGTDDAGSDNSEGSDDPDAPKEPEETKVKVSIKEKDAVAWIEVKLDGKSVLASQEVGPFAQEFTVTDRIEITTDKPSDVTITKNGKKVRYDTKVAGVAKLTITVPKPEEDAEGDAGDADTQGAQGAAGDQAVAQ